MSRTIIPPGHLTPSILTQTVRHPEAQAASDPLNESPEENRIVAGHVIAAFQRAEATLTAAITDIAKWILTSLLAINGGAAIATWGIAMPAEYKVASSAAFVIGILSALLCGLFGLHSIQRTLRPVGEQIGYWATVQADGFRVEESEDFEAVERESRKGSLPSTVAGWASAALFLAGIMVAGFGAILAAPAPH